MLMGRSFLSIGWSMALTKGMQTATSWLHQFSLPDEVVDNVSGMDIHGNEGREGAAVQVGQGPPDQAGEGPQLGRACQHVLSKGSRGAGRAQALLYPSTPAHLHCYCLSVMCCWLEAIRTLVWCTVI